MNTDSLPLKRHPRTPGEIIVSEFLKPLVKTQQHLADALGTDRARINAILTGRRAITLDLAVGLEKVLGPSALFWMNLQLRADLWKMLREAEVSERLDALQPLPGVFRKRRLQIRAVTWEPRGNPWHSRSDEV